MSTKTEERDIKVIEFEIAKDRGFAGQAASMSIPGYRFLKMERKGTKAKVWFKKVKE